MAETDGVELSVLPLFSPSLDPSLLLPFLRIDTSTPLVGNTEPAPGGREREREKKKKIEKKRKEKREAKGSTLSTKYLRNNTNNKNKKINSVLFL